MKRISLLASLLVIGAVSPVASAHADNAIKFVNNTKWSIHEMYFSPTKEKEWGADQLADKTIEPKESFTLTGIPTGKYDVKLVDEDSDECVVEGVKIAESETVTLTDEMLVGCQAATKSSDGDEE